MGHTRSAGHFFVLSRPILSPPVAYTEGSLGFAFGGGIVMTQQQKEIVIKMRREGCSYSRISKALGISKNTVKSFCRRNNLGGVTLKSHNQIDNAFCRQCGAPLTHTIGAKQKRFCSAKCRMAWWNAHPEAVNRKAIYTFTCAHCGAAFESYGNKHRKYCSRACYGKSKAVRHE